MSVNQRSLDEVVLAYIEAWVTSDDGAGAGARIPISSGVDQHHGVFRFSWVMVDPQERQIILEGMDFVELAEDGRLQRITGFFGSFPPIPESWSEDLVWRGE